MSMREEGDRVRVPWPLRVQEANTVLSSQGEGWDCALTTHITSWPGTRSGTEFADEKVGQESWRSWRKNSLEVEGKADKRQRSSLLSPLIL